MFLKEPGFAETNWHSDLRMAPFDTVSDKPRAAGNSLRIGMPAATAIHVEYLSDCPLHTCPPRPQNAFVTAWVPLRPILGAANVGGSGEPDSGLMFAAGSHR